MKKRCATCKVNKIITARTHRTHTKAMRRCIKYRDQDHDRIERRRHDVCARPYANVATRALDLPAPSVSMAQGLRVAPSAHRSHGRVAATRVAASRTPRSTRVQALAHTRRSALPTALTYFLPLCASRLTSCPWPCPCAPPSPPARPRSARRPPWPLQCRAPSPRRRGCRTARSAPP